MQLVVLDSLHFLLLLITLWDSGTLPTGLFHSSGCWSSLHLQLQQSCFLFFLFNLSFSYLVSHWLLYIQNSVGHSKWDHPHVISIYLRPSLILGRVKWDVTNDVMCRLKLKCVTDFTIVAKFVLNQLLLVIVKHFFILAIS